MQAVRTPARHGWPAVRAKRRHELPQGPVTENQLVQWDVRVAEGLHGAAQLKTLQAHLLRGISFHTQFSGLDCAREACLRGIDRLAQQHAFDPQKAVEKVIFTSTCDIDPAPTFIQTEMPHREGPPLPLWRLHGPLAASHVRLLAGHAT